MKKLPVGLLKNGRRKKTTHCTPKELLGRIKEICDSPSKYTASWSCQDSRKLSEIKELLEEWMHTPAGFGFYDAQSWIARLRETGKIKMK